LATAKVGSLKIVGIIASLTALALVLSPTFSLLQVAGRDNSVNDATFLNDDTVIENVSKEDLAACSSLNVRVDEILAVINGTVDERKLASDTLIAEFCSRPVLIHEIMSADSKGLSLVAYACDASSRKIGTSAIQESLADYKVMYCDSAKKLIINETNTFLESVEQFRMEYLPLFQAGLEDDENKNTSNETGSPHFNVTSVNVTLDEITQSLDECLVLVDAGEYYPAAKSFDVASKKFIALFQQESD